MSSIALELAHKIKRSETILGSDLKDGIVMMDIEEGNYYGMDAPGSRIWELAEVPISVGEICQTLEKEYEIGAEQCRNEVLVFVNELIQRKIVVTVES